MSDKGNGPSIADVIATANALAPTFDGHAQRTFGMKDWRFGDDECGAVEREFSDGAWVCNLTTPHKTHRMVWRTTAERIRRENFAQDVAEGRTYRCTYCGEKSPAAEWTLQDVCPKCGRKYDAAAVAAAQDSEE